jgi:hypothetical protein
MDKKYYVDYIPNGGTSIFVNNIDALEWCDPSDDIHPFDKMLILRDPVDRTISNLINDLEAGNLDETGKTFEELAFLTQNDLAKTLGISSEKEIESKLVEYKFIGWYSFLIWKNGTPYIAQESIGPHPKCTLEKSFDIVKRITGCDDASYELKPTKISSVEIGLGLRSDLIRHNQLDYEIIHFAKNLFESRYQWL